MYSIKRIFFSLLTERYRRFVEELAKSLVKAGHVLVSGVRRIMQRVTCTEGLDGSDHLRDFVPAERLKTVTTSMGRAIQNIAGGHSSIDVCFRYGLLGEGGSPSESIADKR